MTIASGDSDGALVVDMWQGLVPQTKAADVAKENEAKENRRIMFVWLLFVLWYLWLFCSALLRCVNAKSGRGFPV
jgi:hypothetical protein